MDRTPGNPSPRRKGRGGKQPDGALRPVLLKRLRLRCGEWVMKELRVNRHLQPFDQETPHRHPHGQLLLYLRGRGTQRIGSKIHPVAPGAVFFIPPGKEHSFLEQSPRLAICMVADLDGEGPVRLGVSSGWLPAEELARVRQRINNLAHHRDPSDGSNAGLELGPGAAALLLLESCRRACLIQSASDPAEAADSSLTRRLLRSLDPGGLAPAPGEIARRVGLQQDYLNRLVRRGTGLTLGQWRASQLLKASERELAKGESIGEAAVRLGFSDPNYFSRWFRRQTGVTPGAWQKSFRGGGSALAEVKNNHP